MKLSCCDHSFPLLPHEHVCELVRTLGFDAINIALWGGHSHIRPEEVRTDVAGWAARLDERIHGRGLEIADLFLIPDPDYAVMAVNNPDAGQRARGRELFEEMLGFAVRLRAGGITLIPGLDFEGEPHERSLERAAEELAARVEIAGQAGVRVSVEPHIGSVSGTPADTLRLLELTPGLEVTLDHSHFAMQGYAQDDLDPALGRVRHVHARGAKLGRLQVGMADNEIDFERMVDVLREAGYDGHLATEYLWINQAQCNECDTLSETILMRDRLSARLTNADDY
ncbi:sugar phosphate isomerase/epimerase family protein [Rhizohabitans arisaemae]|uniref:sugar phosphate isomerase/epimerase family protein n=1 Tax=Rhizohabitans arisaemae TaxID=2720610 RepID=UPI0024B1188D|nr:sugar phosphate isomerase/epimerase [Rhizohabitans arisaemae]